MTAPAPGLASNTFSAAVYSLNIAFCAASTVGLSSLMATQKPLIKAYGKNQSASGVSSDWKSTRRQPKLAPCLVLSVSHLAVLPSCIAFQLASSL